MERTLYVYGAGDHSQQAESYTDSAAVRGWPRIWYRGGHTASIGVSRRTILGSSVRLDIGRRVQSLGGTDRLMGGVNT